jgi:hypothetical protein
MAPSYARESNTRSAVVARLLPYGTKKLNLEFGFPVKLALQKGA